MPEKGEHPPLHADQRRAAALLAAGVQDKAAAAEVGVAPKTVQRWKQRDDFAALVRKQRESMLPEVPTAEAVLTAGLSATKRDGQPDWSVRIAAAKALLSTEVASPEARAEASRAVEIYLPAPDPDPDDEDDGAPRPWPIEGVGATNGSGEAGDA